MPRYIEPKNGGVTLLVVSYTFLPLTVITVLLRIWARRLKKTTLQLNDYAIIIGSVRVILLPSPQSTKLIKRAQILAVGNTILTILGQTPRALSKSRISVKMIEKLTLISCHIWWRRPASNLCTAGIPYTCKGTYFILLIVNRSPSIFITDNPRSH